MLIIAPAFDVQVTFGRVGKRFKEMIKHFCRHITDPLTLEIYIPNQPVSAAEINGNLSKAIVHRQKKSIPFNPFLYAQSLLKTASQYKRCVFDGVMFINLKITIHTNLKIEIAMSRDLLQHVIKKWQSGTDFRLPRTI